MCGIAGIYAHHPAAGAVERGEMRLIRDHMRARGPDGKGEWYSDDGRLALGHRRLAIIDLSERGAQPMVSADGSLAVTFNGEIYNYRALRDGLEARGRSFRSDSDTEVLLHLYAEKGEAMVHELRGMFAFGLWDRDKGALLLARDPFGVKPLYYADDGTTLRFASQVKALIAGGGVSTDPEPAGIVGFYLFGSVPEPYTLYEQVRSVPAGSLLRVDGLGPGEPRPYFSVARVWRRAEQASPGPPEERREAVREALLDSVRHHMVADVPIGAFLSAGIDSGALLGLMSETLSAPAARRRGRGGGAADALQTITLAFEEYRGTHDDESPIAAEVAARYGARQSTRFVSQSELAADLPRILEAMDQPTIDGINTWFVSKAAREAGLKVAVSGLGGDELFGGYPSFRDVPRWARLLWLPGRVPGLGRLAEQVQGSIAPLFSSVNPKAAGLLRYGGSYPGAYLLKRGLFLPHELPLLLDPDLARDGLSRLDPLALIGAAMSSSPASGRGAPRRDEARQGFGPKTAFGRVAALESALYMRNQLLRDTDWSSMAHSLEVRVPLVDAWLARDVARWLLRPLTPNRKHLLASSPENPLPGSVLKRRGSSFTTPIDRWQKIEEGTQAWRRSSLLVRGSCPWARRWAYSVASGFEHLGGCRSGCR
jgi:asparagine synthase (glutamine-hydrolysing)